VTNKGLHSCKFSQPCEQKTHEGITSKFQVVSHINTHNTQQLPVEPAMWLLDAVTFVSACCCHALLSFSWLSGAS
jgi:hypothetical protein